MTMKKLFRLAFWYAVAGMAGGVFYREFTKLNGFTGTTSLARVHVHLLVLGTLVCLVLGILCAVTTLQQQPRLGVWLCVYHTGLVWTAGMLLLRGVLQVLGTPLSTGASAAVSGVAGLGHMLLGVGLACVLWRVGRCEKQS